MRFRLSVVVLAVAIGCGCGAAEPEWEWPVQSPEQQGMDAALLEAARAYAFQDGKHTQGVVVVRRGVIVAEWYEDGADVNSYAASWSIAKSVTSALIGIALDEGALDSVDVPLADFFVAWQDTAHAAIRLEHVLHMASGLEWLEDYDISNIGESDVAQLVLATDSPLAYVLDRPLAATPNTNFVYSSGDALLLSGVLQEATGMTVGEYARKRLFEPLDIHRAEWWSARTGETLTYCCLDMTTRDFARFGLLYLQGGAWDGDQVVPASWVEASIAPSPLSDDYGYQWWLGDDRVMALGHDGQYIYIVPSLELVVVRNGHYDKYPGEPIADPTLFLRYPSDGLSPGAGTLPPDSWSDEAFLGPIIDSIGD